MERASIARLYREAFGDAAGLLADLGLLAPAARQRPFTTWRAGQNGFTPGTSLRARAVDGDRTGSSRLSLGTAALAALPDIVAAATAQCSRNVSD